MFSAVSGERIEELFKDLARPPQYYPTTTPEFILLFNGEEENKSFNRGKFSKEELIEEMEEGKRIPFFKAHGLGFLERSSKFAENVVPILSVVCPLITTKDEKKKNLWVPVNKLPALVESGRISEKEVHVLLNNNIEKFKNLLKKRDHIVEGTRRSSNWLEYWYETFLQDSTRMRGLHCYDSEK